MENLLNRDRFREGVFARDNNLCVICGALAKDAHHIVERRLTVCFVVNVKTPDLLMHSFVLNDSKKYPESDWKLIKKNNKDLNKLVNYKFLND